MEKLARYRLKNPDFYAVQYDGLNGEDAMPRLTDGAAEALGKMFPDEDFSQYVDRGRLQ